MRYLKTCITALVFFFTIHSSANSQSQVLVVYHSETGNTKVMAQAVAEGAESVDSVSVLFKTGK